MCLVQFPKFSLLAEFPKLHCEGVGWYWLVNITLLLSPARRNLLQRATCDVSPLDTLHITDCFSHEKTGGKVRDAAFSSFVLPSTANELCIQNHCVFKILPEASLVFSLQLSTHQCSDDFSQPWRFGIKWLYPQVVDGLFKTIKSVLVMCCKKSLQTLGGFLESHS